MHDLSVDRTTNGRGLLADMDATRIRKLDAGQDQSVPTLRDALDLVENRVPVNIELKSWDGCAQAVAAVLREYIAERSEEHTSELQSLMRKRDAVFRL